MEGKGGNIEIAQIWQESEGKIMVEDNRKRREGRREGRKEREGRKILGQEGYGGGGKEGYRERKSIRGGRISKVERY